jgi:phosphodiesterase/alkaline phosphatase D-like protein
MSYDTSGNIGESAEDSFTTSSPSSLSSIKIVSTSLSQATITWSTSQKMTSEVEYGITDTYGQSKADSTMDTTHTVNLSGLTVGTMYHFRVKGKDGNNNMYSSGDYTFQPKSPPKVSGITVSNITEHDAQINSWYRYPSRCLVTYFEKNILTMPVPKASLTLLPNMT